MDKMIKKLAWSFHNSTGIDYKELYSEANLAYCEALLSYNPAKGTKQSTYVFSTIKNALITFVKNEKKHYTPTSIEDILLGYTEKPWEDLEQCFKGISKKVIDVVLEVDEFNGSSREMRGQVVETLRERGWSWPTIWDGMREVKAVLTVN